MTMTLKPFYAASKLAFSSFMPRGDLSIRNRARYCINNGRKDGPIFTANKRRAIRRRKKKCIDKSKSKHGKDLTWSRTIF